jgi:hypothetical protein
VGLRSSSSGRSYWPDFKIQVAGFDFGVCANSIKASCRKKLAGTFRNAIPRSFLSVIFRDTGLAGELS